MEPSLIFALILTKIFLQGHDWTKKFVFVCSLDQLIEYKYVVGPTINPENGVLKWEEGQNRELNFLHSSELEYPLSNVLP